MDFQPALVPLFLPFQRRAFGLRKKPPQFPEAALLSSANLFYCTMARKYWLFMAGMMLFVTESVGPLAIFV